MKTPQIAIIGATGNVGRIVVATILQKKLAAPSQIKLFASKQSKGQVFEIENHAFQIEETTENSFNDCEICIFNTESDISAYFIPFALKAGAYVIDSSSHFRLHPEVPLIIPPVNKQDMNLNQKLYAHANCLASPLATVLNPLHHTFGIKRAQVATYQSVSGAGKSAMDECWQQTHHVLHDQPAHINIFPKQIAFNIFPQVGQFRPDGYATEEYKIISEVRKVLGDIHIHATSVRVPVLIGHSMSVSVELLRPYDMDGVFSTLDASSIRLKSPYVTPLEVVGEEDVFVGRIREDQFEKQWLHFWLCSDNLRRGAATDATEMLEQLLALFNNQQTAATA